MALDATRRGVFTAALVLAFSVGCTSTSDLDRVWVGLTKAGAEVFRIQGDNGADIVGVFRARSEPVAPLPAVAAAPWKIGAEADTVPAALSPEVVQQIIRANLASIKACYLRVSRSGAAPSGRAIISFRIDRSGRTEDGRVDAPAFAGTLLPSCVLSQIASWGFPPSRLGSSVTRHPFVFQSS